MKQINKNIKKYLSLTLKCWVFITLIASITSCERCNSLEARDGKLAMELSPKFLLGNNKTFHLTLTPQDANKIVDYKNFKLKLTLIAEAGDIAGSTVIYESFDKAGNKINQKVENFTCDLSHFFIGGMLEPGDLPLETDFTIQPGPGADQILFRLELLDATAQDAVIKTCEGKWKTGFNLEITNLDQTGKITNSKEIKLEINKQSSLTTITPDELANLQLSVKRLEGNQAKISTAPDTNSAYILYPINATLATDGLSAALSLLIDPATDNQAKFVLQLLNRSNEIVSEEKVVEWERLVQLDLKAEDDSSDPASKKVKVTITNNGKLELPANEARLSWYTNDDDVTIEGAKQGNKLIPTIAPNGNFITVFLDDVLFTNAKLSTNLKLELDWNELATPVTISHPLTAIPVDLNLTRIEFDKTTNHIKYVIRNNDLIHPLDLQIRCINTQQIDQNAAVTMPLPAPLHLDHSSDTGEQFLQVDFKDEDQADFKFEILFGNLPVNFKYDDGNGEKIISSVFISAVAKQVNLKLVDNNNNEFYKNKLKLRGANKEVNFKIALKGDPQDLIALDRINISRIKLMVDKSALNDATLMYEGNEVEENLPGDRLKLGAINNILTLNLHRGRQAEAMFNLQLMYDKKGNNDFKPLGEPLTVEWKEDDFSFIIGEPIKGVGALLGTAVGEIILINKTSNMDPQALTLVLDNQGSEVKFCFVQSDGNPINNGQGGDIAEKATLSQLLGVKGQVPINMPSEVYFSIQPQPEGYQSTDATLSIFIEQEGTEIHRSVIINWKANQDNAPENKAPEEKADQSSIFSEEEIDILLNTLFPTGREELERENIEAHVRAFCDKAKFMLDFRSCLKVAIVTDQLGDLQDEVPESPQILKTRLEFEKLFLNINIKELLDEAFQKGKQQEISKDQLRKAIQEFKLHRLALIDNMYNSRQQFKKG